jgi:hypothetical protein
VGAGVGLVILGIFILSAYFVGRRRLRAGKDIAPDARGRMLVALPGSIACILAGIVIWATRR